MTMDTDPVDREEFAQAMAWRTGPQGEAFDRLMRPHRPRGVMALGYQASASVIESTNGDALPLPEEALPLTLSEDFPIPTE